ncbi:MAG TPA: serpin family protein [Atribacteraceae bacterium]|nr:serpin family protein [Atribacteraceae bacterium]
MKHRQNTVRLTVYLIHTVLFLTLVAVLGGCIDGQHLTAQPPTQRTDHRLILGANAFAFRLLSQLSNDERGENVFFSPISVYFALMMAADGAGTGTRQAMIDTLHASALPQEEITRGLSNLLTVLENPDPRVQMTIANSLWVRENFPIIPGFLQNAQEFYQAQVSELDFLDPAAPARINEWITNATGGKILSIVDSINPDIVLFLINAIHFQGTWTRQFDPNLTREGVFYPSGGGQVKLPMMQLRSRFDYLEIADIQIIRLPYGDENVSMLIFLPDLVGSSLDEVIRHITTEGWRTWLDQLEETEVTLTLPRFSVEFSDDLNEALKKMGMEVAFDPDRADFSGIVEPPPNAYISRVAHKAYLAVGEEGTEAAAVTSVEVGVTSAPLDEITMLVNRPFLCAIVDEASGVILFMGTIQKPAQN